MMPHSAQPFDFMGLVLAKRLDLQFQSETVLAMLQEQTAFENETMGRALIKNLLRPLPHRPVVHKALVEKPVTPTAFG